MAIAEFLGMHLEQKGEDGEFTGSQEFMDWQGKYEGLRGAAMFRRRIKRRRKK